MPAKNVVVLTSDEMRGDCPGFMGNPDCRTPNLDALAQRGVVFDRHFTVHGKCVPSRIAMMTGRYCHTDGFRTIHQHLPPGDPNLMGFLRAQGYETAVFGHNHVWEDLFFGEEKDKPRSDGAADYHSFVGPFHDLAFLEDEAPAPTAPVTAEVLNDREGAGGRIEGTMGGFKDLNRARQAVKYLTEVRDRSKPFYLHVNMGSPHPAYRVEEPFYSMYDRATLTKWPHELPKNAPLPMQRMREVRTGLEVDPQLLVETQAVYYGMITRVDRDLGMVLECLETQGLLENSIVLFTTDHGDFAGQYGLVEKWDTCMDDCIMHVPFILWHPDLPHGARVASLSEHVDIPRTVLELLGMEPDWGVQGESMLPLLRGERCKAAVFGDGGHEEEMWGRFSMGQRPRRDGKQRPLSGKQITYRDYPETMARTKMVRTYTHKLVMRLTGGNELYDLEADPWELDNRWDDPALNAVKLELMQKLVEWSLRTDTDRPYQPNVAA